MKTSLDDRQAMLNRLTAIMQSLATVRTQEELAQAIASIMENTIVVEYAGIFMKQFDTGTLGLRYTKGFTAEEAIEAERTAWERHPGWVIRNKQMLHVADTDLDDRTQDSKRTRHVRSRLWFPIMADGEAVGAIGLASITPNAFADEHVVVLQYAATTSGFMFANLRDKWALEQQFLVAEEQRRELVALSSPLVEVGSGIVVLPIIGRMDEIRSHQMTEKLLGVIVSKTMRVVILDLTGVATIDAASIEHLGRMFRAVRLLGSECVFSGISGQTATLITDIGIDLGGWKTFATVRQALGSLSNASASRARG